MRAMIIFNPTAGQSDSLVREIKAAAGVWTNQGWRVEIRATGGPGDGTRLAREAAAAHYDVVMAAGGDGTINEVINGLAGSTTALGSLPLGTMNVWARELGLPLQPRAAAAALLESKVRSIDLGRANERYFLLMAGIGFDAAITAGVRYEEKRRLGALAYVFRGLEMALRIRGTRARVILDGKSIKGRVLMVVIGNSQLYGGLVKITHRATIDDGLLDICVIRGNNFASALLHFVSIVRRRHSLNPDIKYYRARTVQVIAQPSLPVQVDGDSIGHTPMTFEVVPKALKALMPAQLPDDLVQSTTDDLLPIKRRWPHFLEHMVRRKH